MAVAGLTGLFLLVLLTAPVFVLLSSLWRRPVAQRASLAVVYKGYRHTAQPHRERVCSKLPTGNGALRDS